MLSSERKSVLLHSQSVLIILTQKTVNAIGAKIEVAGIHRITDRGTQTEKHFLWGVACQVMVPAYFKAAMPNTFRSTGIMPIETHQNIVEQRFCTTEQGILDIWTGKAFYVCIANLMAKPVNLPKFVIVSSASKAFGCLIHVRIDEPCPTAKGGPASKQCNSTSSVHVAHLEGSELWDEQVDRHIAVRESDGRNLNRRDE